MDEFWIILFVFVNMVVFWFVLLFLLKMVLFCVGNKLRVFFVVFFRKRIKFGFFFGVLMNIGEVLIKGMMD